MTWEHDADASLPVEKNAFRILVDARMMPGYVWPEPTPEERERRAAEHRAEVAAQHSAIGRWIAVAADESQPKVLRDLLVMHAPVMVYDWLDREDKPSRRTFVNCDECQDGDDHAMWPCGTAHVLAEHYGIETEPGRSWMILVRDVLPE